MQRHGTILAPSTSSGVGNAILKEYGTSVTCNLDVSHAQAGLQASLGIGSQNISTIPLTNREDLTDALILNQSMILRGLDLTLSEKDPHQAMRNRLDDPIFSHANFVGITIPDPETSGKNIFHATFRDPAHPGQDRILEFSNRPGSNGELRGARLQDMLSNGPYGSLAGLISQVHGTAEDAQIIYATNGARQMLSAPAMNLKGEATGDEALFKDEAEVDDFIRNLNTQHLGSLPIAKTHYAAANGRYGKPVANRPFPPSTRCLRH